MNKFYKTISLLLAVVFVFSGCGRNKKPESTLRYDLDGNLYTLDPQYANQKSEMQVINNSFEGLTALSKTGEVIPACAESWKVSHNGTVYTFTLRDDIRWANGDAVVADDFVFGIKRLFNSAAFSPEAESFLMIKNATAVLEGRRSIETLGITAKSDRELEIKLEYADPSILSVLSRASASPCQKKFFDDQKGKYGLNAQNILCNGPFLIHAWENEYIILSRNPQYRKEVNIERVNMYINREDSLGRFIEGKTDAFLVPFYRLNEAQQLTGETFYDQSWIMILNYENEILANKEVRASLISAIEAEQTVKELPEYLKRYDGVIAPDLMLGGSLYRDLVSQPARAPMPDEARKTFLSALNDMGKNDVGKMSLLVSEFKPGPQLGGEFQKQWQQKFSAFINMEQLEYGRLLSRVSNGDFDIAVAPLISQSGSAIDCLALFEGIESEISEPVTQALTAARQQTDAEKAAEQLFLAEQYLIDEYIVIPLFSAPSLFVVGEGVSGVYYNNISHTVNFAEAVCQRD